MSCWFIAFYSGVRDHSGALNWAVGPTRPVCPGLSSVAVSPSRLPFDPSVLDASRSDPVFFYLLG